MFFDEVHDEENVELYIKPASDVGGCNVYKCREARNKVAVIDLGRSTFRLCPRHALQLKNLLKEIK